MAAARRPGPAPRAERPRADARTRKSIATRERIMAAATALMSERGATDFQMNEVSERCGLSKGSLYYYFSDRAELVQAIFDRSADELVGRVERAVAQAPSSADSVRRIMRALAEGVWMGSPLTLAMTRELLSVQNGLLPSVEGRLERIVAIIAVQLERAKGEGLIRREVDCRVVADALAGAFVFIVLDCADAAAAATAAGNSVGGEAPGEKGRDARRLSEKDLRTADHFVDVMLDLAFRGIGTDEGQALLAPLSAGDCPEHRPSD